MADTLDIVSLAEAKVILSIGALDTSKDGNLERAITAVSRRLDKLVGPAVQRVVTDERHNGGTWTIELRQSPCTAITTVTEYDSSGAATLLTEETHITKPTDAWLGPRYVPSADLYSGYVVRRTGGSDTFFTPGRSNVLVTYTAGRYADTAAVDARFKEAAGLMLRNLWRAYEVSVGQVNEYDVPISNFPTYAIPNAVYELLHPEWQPEIGFGA